MGPGGRDGGEVCMGNKVICSGKGDFETEYNSPSLTSQSNKITGPHHTQQIPGSLSQLKSQVLKGEWEGIYQ